MTTPLVVLAGPAGTGKSTLGARLAERMGGALVDLDGLTPAEHPSRSHRYTTLTRAAVDAARAGTPVVAAAPWTQEMRDPVWFEALDLRLTRTGVRLLVVWLRPERAVLRQRLAHRARPPDAAKLADWDAWAATLSRTPRVPHLAIAMTTPTAEAVETVLAHLPR